MKKSEESAAVFLRHNCSPKGEGGDETPKLISFPISYEFLFLFFLFLEQHDRKIYSE